MSKIADNLKFINDNIAKRAKEFGRNMEEIKLVAVSKTKPKEDIISALSAGAVVFGENYVQELKEKEEDLRGLGYKPVWHFIGHLQSNKVKYIAPFVSMIHSVDSIKLAEEIDKQAEKNNRIIDILLQVHIAEETTKTGCELDDLEKLADETALLKNIRVKGLMTIGTFTSEEEQTRKEFRLMKDLRDKISQKYPNIIELSMGMTGDYEIAIEEGATMLRIGSAIFGNRIYNI